MKSKDLIGITRSYYVEGDRVNVIFLHLLKLFRLEMSKALSAFSVLVFRTRSGNISHPVPRKEVFEVRFLIPSYKYVPYIYCVLFNQP